MLKKIKNKFKERRALIATVIGAIAAIIGLIIGYKTCHQYQE